MSPRRAGLAWVAAAVIAAALLAGCGKKGAPVAPGPAENIIYPHPYPSL